MPRSQPGGIPQRPPAIKPGRGYYIDITDFDNAGGGYTIGETFYCTPSGATLAYQGRITSTSFTGAIVGWQTINQGVSYKILSHHNVKIIAGVGHSARAAVIYIPIT